MGTILALTEASPFAAAADSKANSKETLVYFGTYSGPKSKGVYVSKLDMATGKLGPAELAVEAESPSFLAVHPSRSLLYAVNEVSNFNGQKSGAVSAYAMDRASGKLALLNQQPSGGGGPCHLNVDISGRCVLVANYGGGSCSAFPIAGDGRLEEASAFIQHRGSSVNPQRQTGPHAHGIYLDQQNQFAFVPDLGLDKVLIYKFNSALGKLEPNDPPYVEVAPGSGPRHFAFHPGGRHAYVINEMLCTVTAFSYDPPRGALEPRQTISTLRPGETVRRGWSTAELEVHPSGRFLYGSNRGHDTIVVYAVDPETGEVRLVEHVETGKTPRGFGIDPTGQFLIVGNQDSDTVMCFRIEPKTGKLTSTGQTLEVGRPVSVKFVAK